MMDAADWTSGVTHLSTQCDKAGSRGAGNMEEQGGGFVFFVGVSFGGMLQG